MADAIINIERTPFKEAIELLKNKTALPSGAYTEVLHEMHNKAFVIAGVTKTHVVSDVQDYIAECMEKGIPFKQAEKKLHDLLDDYLPPSKTGKDNSGWRIRNIYETNMRVAYAAGRQEQMMRITKTHPYWQYCLGESKVHREEHVKWNGLVLRWDDPWWDTHYPPNGWGCNCNVEALDDIDLRELGKKGPDRAPVSPLRTVNYGGKELKVPEGVHPSWAYAPGAGGNEGLLRSLAHGIPSVAAEAWAEIKYYAVEELSKSFKGWSEAVLAFGRKHNHARMTGFIESNTLVKAEVEGMFFTGAGIEMADEQVIHAMRDYKHSLKIAGTSLNKAVTESDFFRLPEILAYPQVVLYDKEDPALIYVFKTADPNYMGKVVVKPNFSTESRLKGNRGKRFVNSIRTAGVVKKRNLEDTNRYIPLQGSL